MFQTGRIAARPSGMNAGNNIAFLQQAQAGRVGGFNPFAQAAPSQRTAPPPFGGQFGQQDIGTVLQQFSQPYGASPFGAIAQSSPAQAQRAATFMTQYRQPTSMFQTTQALPATQAPSSRQAQLMAQEAAMRQAVSAAPAGGGMTLGGGPRNFGMTQSPQGMNSQNNMAFLRQAQASSLQGFNPFAR